jgi:hypothetical protein
VTGTYTEHYLKCYKIIYGRKKSSLVLAPGFSVTKKKFNDIVTSSAASFSRLFITVSISPNWFSSEVFFVSSADSFSISELFDFRSLSNADRLAEKSFS